MKKNLALMMAFLIFFQIFFIPVRSNAGGIPVFDGVGLVQSILEVLESIMQTAQQADQYAKQIQEYQAQLKQLEDQLKNTVAPAAYIWSEILNTIQKIEDLQSEVQSLYAEAGGLEAYLAKYGNIEFYKTSPEFGKDGVNNWFEVTEPEFDQNQYQKKSNDAMSKTIELQTKQFKKDVKQLKDIQRYAQGAEGRMEAIQYGNQLASMTNDQLLQLRRTLLSMHQAELAKIQSAQDAEAREIAATEVLMSGDFEKVQATPYQDFPTFQVFR